MDLPPNCGVVRIEIDRSIAFDGGITIDVGTAASVNRFQSAAAVSTTGVTNWNLGAAWTITESKTVATPVYLKKSGATTVGACRIILIIEIRG
jgi:hypothetical protein